MRKHNALFCFPLEVEREIISLYLDKKYSITKIAKEYGVNRDTVSRLLKRNDIALREMGSHLRKHPLDEYCFDNVNSEDKAYFLGLLYADGCNHSNGSKKKVDISLQEQDKDILIAFSKLLYSGNEHIQYVKGRNGNKNQYRLTISGKIISQRLSDLGCIAKKSLILEWPTWLTDPDLQRHFIRGYFDGDGCITKSLRRQNYEYSWSMVSTQAFCNKVSEIISNTNNIHVCSKQTCPDNDITQTIYVRGNCQVLEIMSWLYQDATIYLKRKYEKYLSLKDQLS